MPSQKQKSSKYVTVRPRKQSTTPKPGYNPVNAAGSIYSKASSKVEEIASTMKDKVTSAAEYIDEKASEFESKASEKIKTEKEKVQSKYDKMSPEEKAMYDALNSRINGVKSALKGGYQAVTDGYIGGVQAVTDQAKGGYSAATDGVKAVNYYATEGYSAATDNAKSGFSAATDAAAYATDSVKSGAGHLYSSIPSVSDIHFPSIGSPAIPTLLDFGFGILSIVLFAASVWAFCLAASQASYDVFKALGYISPELDACVTWSDEDDKNASEAEKEHARKLWSRVNKLRIAMDNGAGWLLSLSLTAFVTLLVVGDVPVVRNIWITILLGVVAIFFFLPVSRSLNDRHMSAFWIGLVSVVIFMMKFDDEYSTRLHVKIIVTFLEVLVGLFAVCFAASLFCRLVVPSVREAAEWLCLKGEVTQMFIERIRRSVTPEANAGPGAGNGN